MFAKHSVTQARDRKIQRVTRLLREPPNKDAGKRADYRRYNYAPEDVT